MAVEEPPVVMKQIIGRVLVRETNAGIGNLVVAAFDQDSRGGPLDHPRDPELDPDAYGHRLGSVITARDGGFELDASHCDPAGGCARPNLVLAVFAPEEPDGAGAGCTSGRGRVLHVSRQPRYHAGAVESYVIRIPQAQLRGLIPASTAAVDLEDAVVRHIEDVRRGAARVEVLRRGLAPIRAEQVARRKSVRDRAKRQVQQLSAIPLALRQHRRFTEFRADPSAAQDLGITEGMARLTTVRPSVRATFDAAALERLGLRQVDGRVVGEVAWPAFAAWLDETYGNDLTRRRSLAPLPPPPPPPPFARAVRDGSTELAVIDTATLEQEIRDRIGGQLATLPVDAALPTRPDLDAVQADLEQLDLRGGPADATAYHDFQTLQLAFRHVWTQAFDSKIKNFAAALYEEYIRLYEDAGIEVPPFTEIRELEHLDDLIREVEATGGVAPLGTGEVPEELLPFIIGEVPPEVEQHAKRAAAAWYTLTAAQRETIATQATVIAQNELIIADPTAAGRPEAQAAIDKARRLIDLTLDLPNASGNRMRALIERLGKLIAEPYAFDVFAPDSYNFGILTTFRQAWKPISYQTGELVATIPLAPGETRKFTHKQVVKRTRSVKEIEKAVASSSWSSAETRRAEAEIVAKATQSTNFKMTAEGAFTIGIAKLKASSEFGMDQRLEASSVKKDFHEAVLKAAADYKNERTVEVNATTATEDETTTSGEISNPNNELTVTYLFYELQRRYQVNEALHRVQPVILIAQDVPAPHEIDEAWLVAHQWVISRVLLDDSFRDALGYLSSGFAGDSVSDDVLRARWQAQTAVMHKLEGQVAEQLALRTELQETVIELTEDQARLRARKPDWQLQALTFGLAGKPGEVAADMVAAKAASAKARLEDADRTLEDLQRKLAGAAGAFDAATKEYAAAMQRRFSRTVAIDQLRVHIKQNILYYMQAIWSHEPPDQRFFRLYNKPIKLVEQGGVVQFTGGVSGNIGLPGGGSVPVTLGSVVPGPNYTTRTVELIEIADVDNPLGYKGNYIMFPLKQATHLTTFMLTEYFHSYFGVRDPDELGAFSIEELVAFVASLDGRNDIAEPQRAEARAYLERRLAEDRPASDIVVVPSGQLFIEALPGSHPLLEDFKLLHRLEDVRKVRAEIRRTELENLRLASRLVAGELEQPTVDKKIVIDGEASVVVGDT